MQATAHSCAGAVHASFLAAAPAAQPVTRRHAAGCGTRYVFQPSVVQQQRQTITQAAASSPVRQRRQHQRQCGCAAARAAPREAELGEPSAAEQAQMDRDATEIAAALASVYEGADPDEMLEAGEGGEADASGDAKGGKLPAKAGRRSRDGRAPQKELPIESLPKVWLELR